MVSKWNGYVWEGKRYGRNSKREWNEEGRRNHVLHGSASNVVQTDSLWQSTQMDPLPLRHRSTDQNQNFHKTLCLPINTQHAKAQPRPITRIIGSSPLTVPHTRTLFCSILAIAHSKNGSANFHHQICQTTRFVARKSFLCIINTTSPIREKIPRKPNLGTGNRDFLLKENYN